jgi:3-oxoacyl-[acyl-carrier protein] reductase
VVITGTTSGLGKSLAAHFQNENWVSIGLNRRQSPDPSSTREFVLNLLKAQEVAQTTSTVIEEFGTIDCWVHNAAINLDRLMIKTSDQDFSQVFDNNLKSAFVCAQSAGAVFKKQRFGQMIHISSFAAKNGPAGQSAYAASKASLIGLTQSLAAEWGRFNAQINVVYPGVLPTRMTQSMDQEELQKLIRSNVLGRSTTLEEVCTFVVFLARMKNVSGQIFQLDSRVSRWT